MQNQTQNFSNSEVTPPEPFRFTFTKPYDSLVNGLPAPVPYVVDGLLTQGGLSILGGKPKSGKSSLSRYLATSVAKGAPFLGRDTEQGDVILVNLEDPLIHLDNCLRALGYDPADGHGQIHITDRLSPSINETLDALAEALTRFKDVRLVVIDHLAKFLRVKDLSEYMPVQAGCQRLRDVAREFSHVHIQALAHCKKVQTDDPFDGILGSTALRGEPDTNLIIFQQNGQRVITSETRVGRAIPPTLLKAEVVESAGALVVRNFSLDSSLEKWQSEKRDKAEKKQDDQYKNSIIDYLQNHEGNTALQKEVLDNVKGKTERLTDAIKELTADGIITIADGTPRTLKLASGTVFDLYMLGRSSDRRPN
jgi:AAA domain